jgi:tetratricopeptide (TPR) repeat protein
MPFVGGESLRDRLQRESALPIPEALRLAREVADALQYAHGQGVIHRDVKPENILLTNGHALVADFGIARAVSRAAGRRNTEDGFAVGTPAYMSPEQASGDPIDGRSDEYALACVLYEMLGGAPPFVGTSGRSVLAQRFTEKPAPVRKARDSVPPEVDAALQKALARVPADRFNTVAEFAQSLDVMDTMGQRRAVPSQLFATLGRFKWIVVIAAAIAAGTWYLATRSPATTPGLYVVLPFRHEGDAAPRLLNGDVCQRLLYDALNGWTGLKLVDGMRAQDAKRQKSDTALTQRDAIGIAKGLGAEWLIWGDVSQIGHQITVQGKVYQVSSGDVVKTASVRIDSSLTDVEQKFGELADSLIVPGSSAADHGAPGTRDIAALTAYAHAHEALMVWDLAPAESLFRAATVADPAFAKAHFWLAQVMSWENYGERNDWNETAARAYAMHEQLGSRDSARAQALSELAAHEYPAACKHYQEMAAKDTLDFVAWYGLADCNRRDRAVIKDAKSPSGWAFRGSYQRAVSAYEHALRIVPSVHLAFAGLGYDRLSRMLVTQPVQLRRGFTIKSDSSRRGDAATSDTLWFGAYASLSRDTLAFVPYPFAEITAGTAPVDSTADAAVAANRQRLLSIAKSWKSAFSQSAAAWESMARALEANGQLAGSDPDESAAAAMARARSFARTRGDSVRTGIGSVRILLESARYADARALGDSMLALSMDPDAKEADDVKGVAALLGHTHFTVTLLRRSAVNFRVLTPAGREVKLPLPVAASARAMLGFVALGGPADSVVRLQQEVSQSVQSLVAPADRVVTRDAVNMLPALLAFPMRPEVMFAVPAGAGGPLPQMQAALARGDSAGARALVRTAVADDARGLPADLSLDMRYQQAWLAAAVGDSAGAAALLDHGLGAIPSYGQYVLDNVPNPAALVRMMILRADLASRARDARTARQWASAAAALWAGADPELQPEVSRMRALAAP